MKTPAISIVLPVYNAEKYISESLESILNQSFADFELIIINDGSTDNTLEIINSYDDKRIRLIDNDHNYIESLNRGISSSRGKYIARMDANDIMMPHRLEWQYFYMENNPQVDVCGSWVEAFGLGKYYMSHPINHEEIISRLLLFNQMTHSSIMMRAESLSRLPWFPDIYKKDFNYAEDYRLWIDLAMENFTFVNIPIILGKYRRSEDQVTVRFADPMALVAEKIQLDYFEFISDKLTLHDQELFNFIDYGIDLCNRKLLKIDSLYLVVSDLYGAYLESERQKGKIKLLFCAESLDERIIDLLKPINFEKYCVDFLLSEKPDKYFVEVPQQVNLFTPNRFSKMECSYDLEVACFTTMAIDYVVERPGNAKKVALIDCIDEDMNEEASRYSKLNEIVFLSDEAKVQFCNLFPDVQVSYNLVYN